mmetsp:Transcript_8023/g.29656  ORF Transcript_8023/g.29656 Transcript_8023/m.29656 type:complete len:325 (+) Transcript_8023:209-1183(+)
MNWSSFASLQESVSAYTQSLKDNLDKVAKDAQDKATKLSEEAKATLSSKAQEAQASFNSTLAQIQSEIATTGDPETELGPPKEEELLSYGVTPDHREFVRGISIRTFRDFPLTEEEKKFADRWQMSEWQEEHARLILRSVKEMSDFRYILCPRKMNECRFWCIYFTIVASQIQQFVPQDERRHLRPLKGTTKEGSSGRDLDAGSMSSGVLVSHPDSDTSDQRGVISVASDELEETTPTKDQDLEAYLKDVLAATPGDDLGDDGLSDEDLGELLGADIEDLHLDDDELLDVLNSELPDDLDSEDVDDLNNDTPTEASDGPDDKTD